MLDHSLLLVIPLFICISCANPKPQNNLKPMTENGLSAADRSVGWTSLFNGSDMDQWRVYKEDHMEGWKVENGLMKAMGTHNADIITKDTFSNFELALEWSIAEGANSGIFFNVRESPEYESVYHTGPEYQLLDDHAYPKSNKVNVSSANYDVHAPTVDVSRPSGTWNTTRLIVNNNKVEHWLNGQKTVSYELYSDDWKQRIAKSKWKNLDSYARYQSGHLALQDHGGIIQFRNIRVRRL